MVADNPAGGQDNPAAPQAELREAVRKEADNLEALEIQGSGIIPEDVTQMILAGEVSRDRLATRIRVGSSGFRNRQ